MREMRKTGRGVAGEEIGIAAWRPEGRSKRQALVLADCQAWIAHPRQILFQTGWLAGWAGGRLAAERKSPAG
ncbi:MAG: hypothetical protein BGO99_03700 [Nitrosospira sp. 56-18]|nr:MAG: hypothetical protein BGO99_03700 [Nitrosospira sp. 56-18]